MKRFIYSVLLPALFAVLSSCESPQNLKGAASNVRVETEDGELIEFPELNKSKQSTETDNGVLSLKYTTVSNAVLLECEFTPATDLDSISLALCFYSLPADSIVERFYVPFSLPYLREKEKNIIPQQYITNKETYNNTFSLITEDRTYSVSILPTEDNMNTVYDPEAPDDYFVAMFNNEGSIRLKGFFGKNLKAGNTVHRRFLLSSSQNTLGSMQSGYHIGEYMNLVHYPCDKDLEQVYDCSMDYLLHNPYAFGKISEDGKCNFYGSVISESGGPYGNGNAVYAMYGNSFSIAALNQYLKEHTQDQDAQERLAAVEDFLLNSDVRTPEGAYWSMLDLVQGKGYVDQAYLKWLETHATAWITYYILDAFEISGNQKYKSAAEKSLDWMVSIQREDGSMPKYFENGQPSTVNMGDIAWAALSFLKGWHLGMGDKYKEAAMKALAWIEANVVDARLYYGSFEDVGGINDSYCPSVTARAFILAYRCTGDPVFLETAKKCLSISLSVITTGYMIKKDYQPCYDEPHRINPSYSQIESVQCYYPCSYTLPMMYLACHEMGTLIKDNPKEREYWYGIAANFVGISDFMRDNSTTKCKYGMEWLTGPFLVFSEWGNMQVCWAIKKVLEEKTQ